MEKLIRVAIFEIANTQPEYLLLFIRAELPHLQIQINGRESECTVLGLVVSSCGKPCPTVKIPCISLNVHLQTICRKCVTNVHTEQVSARAILRFNFTSLSLSGRGTISVLPNGASIPLIRPSVRYFRQRGLRCHLPGIEQSGLVPFPLVASSAARLSLLAPCHAFRVAGLHIQSRLL